MKESKAWLDDELASCLFQDVRLGRRLRLLVERLSFMSVTVKATSMNCFVQLRNCRRTSSSGPASIVWQAMASTRLPMRWKKYKWPACIVSWLPTTKANSPRLSLNYATGVSTCCHRSENRKTGLVCSALENRDLP